MSPLKWQAQGVLARTSIAAWSDEAGQGSPFLFTITESDLGLTVTIADLRRKQGFATYGLPILRLHCEHAEWTVDAVKVLVEQLRPTLPTFEGEQGLSWEQIRDRAAARYQRPTRCAFHHAFPLGATDSTVCQCGRVTKGFLEQAS